jgi:hypothetical protein
VLKRGSNPVLICFELVLEEVIQAGLCCASHSRSSATSAHRTHRYELFCRESCVRVGQSSLYEAAFSRRPGSIVACLSFGISLSLKKRIGS